MNEKMTPKSSAAKNYATSAAAIVRALNRPHGASRSVELIVSEEKSVRPRTGWLYVAISLKDDHQRISPSPLATGIVSGGGRGVMPWVELKIYPEVLMPSGAMLDARSAGIAAALVDLLGKLIPPGGHLMVEYESPGQNETHAALLLRVPPVATELGAMMFHAGFRGPLKDWYISEGGHEGPRKLQANKSPNPKASRMALADHRCELRTFLKTSKPARDADRRIIQRAQARARAILKEIDR
jgi:hypothetical protein